MPKRLLDFARQLNLPVTENQANTLLRYAQLVWQKKDQLNLTSAADLQEVLLRHICDGLQGAYCLTQLARQKGLDNFCVLDAGAGAGYIGITIATVLPQIRVTLVESLEKRCAFMNWAVLSLGLTNVCVKNARLGESKDLQADFVTERAMGQLPDILGICLGAVKPGGAFVAYQGEHPQTKLVSADKWAFTCVRELPYSLPLETKTRHLVIFEKGKNEF